MTARAIARYTRSTARTSSPARNGPRRSREGAGPGRCGPSRTIGGTHFTSCANTPTSPRSSSLRCGRQDRARQADGPPRKARGVIVTGFANHLHVDHGGEPVGRGVRHENAAGDGGHGTVRQRLGENATRKLSAAFYLKPPQKTK